MNPTPSRFSRIVGGDSDGAERASASPARRAAELAQIQSFIRRRGVRRCPTAFAAPTPQAARPIAAGVPVTAPVPEGQ